MPHAKIGKTMGPGVLEHECGFSFAALPGGAVRTDGRAGPGCFAARGPLCPDAGHTAGGAGCLSGVEWGNFSGPLFLSGAAGRRLVVFGGRSLLFGGAWPVCGRGGQLCLAGPPWAEHGRGLPVFPQPHVCSLFYLLSWHGAAGKITFSGRGRAGVSAFRPLACACGRALVRGNIRGRV